MRSARHLHGLARHEWRLSGLEPRDGLSDAGGRITQPMRGMHGRRAMPAERLELLQELTEPKVRSAEEEALRPFPSHHREQVAERALPHVDEVEPGAREH